MTTTAAAAAVTAFYQALVECDLAALDRLWMQDERAGAVRPGGALLRGYREVRAVLPSLFIPGSVRINLSNYDEHRAGDVIWATCVEELRVTIEGFQETGWSQATFLLLDGPAGLRIVHHHASHVPGYNEQGPDELNSWNPLD